MEITHNGQNFRWIGEKYGILYIPSDAEITLKGGTGTILIHNLYIDSEIVDTKHTPEQLVKLGYMELITKPEEKPCQHESDGQVYLSNPVQYKCKKCGKFYRNEGKTETKPEENLEEAFAEDFPNTWGIKPEEKPIEEKIKEVPKYTAAKGPGYIQPIQWHEKQLELLTDSLNAVIKKLNQ